MRTDFDLIVLVIPKEQSAGQKKHKEVDGWDFVEEILRKQESISTDELAKEYGVNTSTLNEYLEAKGFQHWLRNRWICDLKPVEISSLGHDGQNIIWSAAARLAIFFEMKNDGILPIRVYA